MSAIAKIALDVDENACIGSAQYANCKNTLSSVQDWDAAQCISNSEMPLETSISKIGWGGARANSGGARPRTGGARVGTGGPQPGSGRPRKLPFTSVIDVQPPPPANLGVCWYAVEIAMSVANRVLRDISEGETRPGYPRRQGFRAEIPMMRDDPDFPIRPGRLSKIPVPMYPGYVFVQFDVDTDPWEMLRDIDGVLELFMRDASRPEPVKPHGIVEWLLAMSAEELKLRAPQTREIGSIWQVTNGPFASFPARVVACNGIITQVAVMIFGRETPINLPYDALVLI